MSLVLVPEEDKLSLLGIRSVSECAKECYLNNTCRSAVYRENGECLLYVKMPSDLSPTTAASGHKFIGFEDLHQYEAVCMRT